jgi:hypothetical protein
LRRARDRLEPPIPYAIHERPIAGTASSKPDDHRLMQRQRERGPSRIHRGASIVDGNVGGGRNYMEASARLKTELRPAQLLAHYAAQLRADGWTPRSETAGNDVTGQAWRINDREGRAWVGVLIAIALPESEERMMLFRVTPLDSRDR